MYIVVSGSVIVTTTTPGGKVDVQLCELGAGEFFGEGALLTAGGQRSANAVAGPNCVCLAMSKETFDEVLWEPHGGVREELKVVHAQRVRSRAASGGGGEGSGAAAVAGAAQGPTIPNLELSHLEPIALLSPRSLKGAVFFCRYRVAAAERFVVVEQICKSEAIRADRVSAASCAAEALRTLHHPFVDSFLATLQDTHSLYFVSAAEPREDALSVLREAAMRGGEGPEAGSLTEEARAHVVTFAAACLTSAIDYLHELELVHRNISPQSLYFTARGYVVRSCMYARYRLRSPAPSFLHPRTRSLARSLALSSHRYIRLVDFSFVKQISSRAYTCCGSAPARLPPEMILGKGYGASVDWWAAGIALYELYLGEGTPFDDADPLQSYKRILDAAAAGTVWIDVEATHLNGSARHVRRRPELDKPRNFVNALCRLEPTEVRADRAPSIYCASRLTPHLRLPNTLQRLCHRPRGAKNSAVRGHALFEAIRWAQLEAKTLRPPLAPAGPFPRLSQRVPGLEFASYPAPVTDAAATGAAEEEWGGAFNYV